MAGLREFVSIGKLTYKTEKTVLIEVIGSCPFCKNDRLPITILRY